MSNRQRAKRGTIGTRVLLGMDETLHGLAVRAASLDGVSLTEWIRRAIHERLLRSEAERRFHDAD